MERKAKKLRERMRQGIENHKKEKIQAVNSGRNSKTKISWKNKQKKERLHNQQNE